MTNLTRCCSKCNELKPVGSFPLNRKGQAKEAPLSYCRQCRTKQIIENNHSSVEAYLGKATRGLRAHSKAKGLAFDLTQDFLIELYMQQGGLCFYTDEQMTYAASTEYKQWSNISVDKIEPALGYIKKNVVLCTVKANSIKHDASVEEMQEWLPGWHQRLMDRLARL